MGSLLTLYLAAHHPELPGAIAYSPATWVQDPLLPLSTVARHVIKSGPRAETPTCSIPRRQSSCGATTRDPVPAAAQLYALVRRVRQSLPQVVSALAHYLQHGRPRDPSDQRGAHLCAGRVERQAIIKLEESGHVITVDRQWRSVASEHWPG